MPKIIHKDIKGEIILNKLDNPGDPTAPPGSMQELKNYIPGKGGIETRLGIDTYKGMQSALNTECASVTSLHRFYHDDESGFYSAVTTAKESPHEFYAATFAPGDTTSQTIYRFIETAQATTASGTRMIDPVTSSGVVITGTTTGEFRQLNKKVYYTNYDDVVKQIRPRTSAQDTSSLTIFDAGIVDPNATRSINKCEETSGWTTGGSGTCTIYRTGGIRHRLQGNYAIVLEQQTPNACGVFTWTSSTTFDLTTFPDGTTSSLSDFIAFELFRFSKSRISALTIYISTGSWTNYYSCPIVVDASSITDDDGNGWNSYHPQQQTPNAQWQNNPYDNEMFRIRLRKSFFQKTGNPGGWSAITSIAFVMNSDSNTTATDPAKIAIDDIRLLRTPPIAEPNRLVMASFEESESGSSTGWYKDTAMTTKAIHNKVFAREGCSCLEVTAGSTCTLTFDSPKDFSKLPDGSTAGKSHVLKINCIWKGMGGIDWSGWTMPRIKFIDSSGNERSTRFGLLASFLGGGTTQQKIFDPEGTTWSQDSGASFNWDSVKHIQVSGLMGYTGSPQPYYFDCLRLETPNAMQPVNVFEPVELMAIDSWYDFIEPWLKNYGWVAQMGAEIAKGLFTKMRYQTYGMGQITYPDYEHSSIGIAGLRLTAYGSKTFGVTLKQTFNHDLTNYYIPHWQWPPVWDPPTDWGCVTFSTISASGSDYFQIWLASEKPEQVKEVKIKFHGATTGGGAIQPDQANYWEYTIDGSLLASKLRDSLAYDWKDKNKHTEQSQEELKFHQSILDYYKNATDEERFDFYYNLYQGYKNPSTKDEVKEYITDYVRYLGKDRGGWPSATFRWKRRDMRLVQDYVDSNLGTTNRTPAFSAIRGISIEVTGNEGAATVVVDNLIMVKEGSLSGKYYYKLVLEDDEGFFSPSTEPSQEVNVEKKDVYLTNIYTPTTADQFRVKSKRIYRIGGTSSVWRHVGDLAPDKTDFYDTRMEEDLGLVLPDDAYGPPRARVMEPIGNSMYYGDVVDRLNYTRPNRLYKSEAFCPFRVRDLSCIDLPMSQGNSIIGITEYYGHVFVFSQHGVWTTTRSMEPAQKRSEIGCIARRSIASTPFGVIWLSRDGLVIGDISKVSTTFFRYINPLLASYTETQLANAIGFYDNNYYYLFYDQTNAKGLVVYLPTGAGAELEGIAPYSISIWKGRSDGNVIRYGTGDGKIKTMLSNVENDNGTAITTDIRTFDYSDPGPQHLKHLRSLYIAVQKIGTSDVTMIPTAYTDQIARSALDTITATLTTITTLQETPEQGMIGYHVGLRLQSTNRHKISQFILKSMYEEDNLG